MKNPFEDKTDEELKVLYKQYQKFQKTGIIPGSELMKIRDYLMENLKDMESSAWFGLMTKYLLETIGNRWVDKA